MNPIIWPSPGINDIPPGSLVHYGQPKTLLAAKNRREFLEHHCGQAAGWPFCHFPIGVSGGESLNKNLDNLVAPLAVAINSLPQVTTVSCCQGGHNKLPYIVFGGTGTGAMCVHDLLAGWKLPADWQPWDVPLLSLTGERKCESGTLPEYMVQFFDVLALMKFTRDVLGISLERQMARKALFLRRKGASEAAMSPAPEPHLLRRVTELIG